MCERLERLNLTLPLAVILNRFLAPECDFILGIDVLRSGFATSFAGWRARELCSSARVGAGGGPAALRPVALRPGGLRRGARSPPRDPGLSPARRWQGAGPPRAPGRAQ